MKQYDHFGMEKYCIDSYASEMGAVHAILKMGYLSSSERVARALDFIAKVDELRAKERASLHASGQSGDA